MKPVETSLRNLSRSARVAVAALFLAACSSGTIADPVPVLELSAGAGDAMASCLAFDAGVLAEMDIAFEGTATAVDGDRVTLSVVRWYKGGDAGEVAVIGPPGQEALIGGITFEVGGRYLVSATDGTVNYCGFSGEYTPELASGFEEAFGV